MLLKEYRLEIFNSKCQPGALGVHCYAHLAQDVNCVLPYINSVLGGFEYLKNPPAVIYKVQGKLITIHGNKIAINALKNTDEAKKIVEWDKRDEIEPSYQGAPKPKIIEILKLLPKTNCHDCGELTCMVFATKVAEGAKNPDDCTQLNDERNKRLSDYMKPFFNVDL